MGLSSKSLILTLAIMAVDFSAVLGIQRAWTGAASDGSSIYVLGGGTCGDPGCGNFGGGATSTADVWSYDDHEWNSLPPVPTSRFGLAVTQANGIAYAIGGTSGSSSTPLATVEAL